MLVGRVVDVKLGFPLLKKPFCVLCGEWTAQVAVV